MEYTAKYGQSIYDICFQTYGTLKYLLKLIQDNDVDSVNVVGFDQKVFIFDEDLIANNSIFNQNTSNDSIYVSGSQLNAPAAGALNTDDDEGILTGGGIQIIVD